MTTIRKPSDVARDLIEGARQGGATVPTVVGSLVPDEGYVVGGIETAIIRPTDLDVFDAETWCHSVRHVTAQPGVFVGSWQDSQTGLLYLDVVEVYPELAVAQTVAAERGELAIWDLGGNCEIRIASAATA